MSTIRLPDSLGTAPHATVLRWHAEPGQVISADQLLVELETSHTIVHLRAASAGIMGRIIAAVGVTVKVGSELGDMNSNANAPAAIAPKSATESIAHAPSTVEAPSGPVATPILMPQAGNTMEEGRIIQWRVQSGSAIKVGQILCEIETDKSTIEFESPVTGTIGAIVVGDGQSIAVKLPIAYLNDGSIPKTTSAPTAIVPENAPSIPQAPSAPSLTVVPHTPTPPAAPSTHIPSPASPAARHLAREQGIDLSSLGSGSGPGGRILSTDLASAPRNKTNSSAPSHKITAPSFSPISGPIPDPVKRPLSKMRKAIAANLLQSKQTVPHFYLTISINAGAILAYAKQRKADAGCSVNDVIIAALGRTLYEFPAMRSRFEGDSVTEWGSANVGIAVGLDDGLVVPVVMQVERLSLAQLAQETKRVIDNARKGKLENMGKAVFSISNLGMFGVEQFNAIINPPESGILAVSAAREAVIVSDGAMRAGRVMSLTLSADHRVVDGLVAAKFMARLKEILEAPEQLI